jgi:translation elongation factor EF-Tu-like GTPase
MPIEDVFSISRQSTIVTSGMEARNDEQMMNIGHAVDDCTMIMRERLQGLWEARKTIEMGIERCFSTY